LLYLGNGIMMLTATKRWSRPQVSGDVPGARDGHSSCVIGDRMFIFGGYEEGVSYYYVYVDHTLVQKTSPFLF